MRSSTGDQRIRRFICSLTLRQKMELLLQMKLEQDPAFILRVLSGRQAKGRKPWQLSTRKSPPVGISRIAS